MCRSSSGPLPLTWEALSRGPLQQLEGDGAFCFVEGAGGLAGSGIGNEEVGDEAVERGDFGRREGEGRGRLVASELVVQLTEFAPQSGKVGRSEGEESFLLGREGNNGVSSRRLSTRNVRHT